jgi:hypothetical protein
LIQCHDILDVKRFFLNDAQREEVAAVRYPAETKLCGTAKKAIDFFARRGGMAFHGARRPLKADPEASLAYQ